ncbi:hypothetical protein MAQ5080_00557 [Marinomonas aquimarina]|uniref:DUF4402 domain-containing protein n=1 Tax=Marinomonas aquimarina TaxID=295068 RepID=A0A1A8T369_9GAMM|nr:DUF4402 domain-containing protein [Marinomonas aquimarina]SBS26576.1 hypothetical protein MAQ5080_00557 [Marinomonas aquimarina]
MTRAKLRKLTLLLPLMLHLSTCFADIEEVTPLSFGSIVVLSNDSVESISINHNGIVSSTQAIMTVTPPTVGEFLLSNFPLNQRLFLSAQSIQSTTNSAVYSTEQFVMSNVDVPNVIFTDGNGNAQVNVGGTLSTSGSGNKSFVDTAYHIRFQLSVDY